MKTRRSGRLRAALEDFKQITEAFSELFGKVVSGVDFPGDIYRAEILKLQDKDCFLLHISEAFGGGKATNTRYKSMHSTVQNMRFTDTRIS